MRHHARDVPVGRAAEAALGSQGRLKRLRALFLAAAFAFAPLARADTVNVFAAASVREVIEALARDFQGRTHDRVIASFAGSNALARQIEAGAPAEIFISADADWADHVAARGLSASRRDVAGNGLVLIAPASSGLRVRVAPQFPLAAGLDGGRLAIANPESVPAGKYARAALVSLGVWDSVKDRLAPAENVRAALSFVARGETPLGIVYRTDALADPRVRIAGAFPAESHPSIVYPMLLLKGAKPAASAFADYVASSEARETWSRFGFAPPQ
jgi:molybdate transport system substrate-binding protein